MNEENKYEHTNRDKILACAQKLFYERGYDAVGVQEIVDAAGITKPTMYHYFKSKHGLLENLLDEYGNQFLGELEKEIEKDGSYEDVLRNFVYTYISVATKNKEFYLMTISLFSSARDNEAYIAAKPYLYKLLFVVQDFFRKNASKVERLVGKEDFLSISLTGVINYYLLVNFERGMSEEVLLEEHNIEDIVNQFV